MTHLENLQVAFFKRGGLSIEVATKTGSTVLKSRLSKDNAAISANFKLSKEF